LLAIGNQTILPLDAPILVVDSPGNPLWAAIDSAMRRVETEYHAGLPGMDRTIAALAGIVLTDIARLTHESPTQAVQPGQVALARRFRALVDLHFRENWPIEAYVKTLSTTPHLLAKSSHDAYGQSPKEFINERRMLEAKRLLLFTVRPVEDIAYELGLRDAAYFSRFFKSHAGLPPGAWRAERASAPSVA
jgi:AraC family transcriptional activator of pobA